MPAGSFGANRSFRDSGAALLALYQFLGEGFRLLLPVLCFFFPGLQKLAEPRNGLIDRWRRANLGHDRIWCHVSSVGELEQVRPALERLKADGYSVLLSFFSPSVPRLVKNWDFVQYADYLPFDFPDEMNALADCIAPKVLVLNRYDLWPNQLMAMQKRGIPVIVVNASTPPLGWAGKISLSVRRALFSSIHAWSFVDAAAAENWEPYLQKHAKGLVLGDPRVDRALERAEKALGEKRAKDFPLWQRKAFCLVAGSTWPQDEEILLASWKELDFPRSLVIVPHEPHEDHLKQLEAKIKAAGFSSLRYSELREGSVSDILVVDQRGFLAEIYRFGQLAYVGGGFGKHIHSIIEPVAHGVPVAFGPKFRRSPEAVALSATDAALALPFSEAVPVLVRWLQTMAPSGPARSRADEPLRVFIQIHRGAGLRVAEFVESVLESSGNLRAEEKA